MAIAHEDIRNVCTHNIKNMKRIRNNIKGWGEIRGGLQCVTRERQRYSFVCVSVSVLCECERFCLCLCVQGILSYRFRKYNIQSIISHVVRIRFVIHELMQEAFVFFFLLLPLCGVLSCICIRDTFFSLRCLWFEICLKIFIYFQIC